MTEASLPSRLNQGPVSAAVFAINRKDLWLTNASPSKGLSSTLRD